MRRSKSISLLAGLAALAVTQLACAQWSRSSAEPSSRRGWEASIGLMYQDAKDVSFNGGSFLKSEDDFGVVAGFGYTFNPNIDLIVGFESATIGYDLTRQSATTPGLTQRIIGDYESFTPVVKVNYNFLDRALTPFVSAGVGWSFIDTNIPTGNATLGCWWDPWWGYFCAPFAETKTTDAFVYQFGAGARWTFNDTYGMRLEYQKQWQNLSRANGTPGFDQLKLTLVVKYW